MRVFLAAFVVVFALIFAVAGPAIAEDSLQTILDNITKDGPSSVIVPDDQAVNDQTWIITGSESIATIVIEIAGNAGSNTFGIYDVGGSGGNVVIFQGGDGEGAEATIEIDQDGNVFVNGGTAVDTFTGDSFGFFLGTQSNGTFYSQSSLNGGDDHMVAFQGKGDTVLLPDPTLSDPNNKKEVVWDSQYILAWEDLPFSISDKDYNDMVVMVSSVIPTPEPGTVFLLGGGLLGLLAYGRRMIKNKK